MKAQPFGVFLAYLSCLSSLTAQQPDPGGNRVDADEPAVAISVENGAMNANFRDQPLHVIAQLIGEKAQVRLVVAEGLLEDRVTLNVKSTAVDVALRALLSSYDTFLFYGSAKNAPSALRTVWVYPKGVASDIYPIPRSDWAGIKELEANLNDQNAAVREAAYEVLFERPDRRSRSLVLDAIKGVSERDSGLRERLLSSALSKGFPLAPEVLVDLSRADVSEHIRWMALDALAFSDNPGARAVAEAATRDASEIVRSRALEIMNQLTANEKAQRSPQVIQPDVPGR